MTYDTKNPVPSTDPRDLDDNAQAFDRLMNSSADTEPDRFGVPRLTYKYVENAATALVNPNVIGLAGLTSGAGKAFRFTNSAGQMSTYDLTSLGIALAGAATQAAARSAIAALGSGDNIASASKLATPRAITATGDATWTINFDGSANASGALTLADSGVAAGTYTRVTVDSKGRVTAGQTSALAVANGGTGATTSAAARTSLGAAASGANSDITGLSALVGTAFTALTLQNGWSLISGYRAVYRKNLGVLQLEMAISGGTATDGTVIATLPAGFRPPFPVAVPVASISNSSVVSSRITIGTDGTLKIYNCSSQVVFAATVGLE